LASCDTLLLRLDPTLVEAFYKLGLDDPVLTTLLQDVDSAERIRDFRNAIFHFNRADDVRIKRFRWGNEGEGN